MATRLMDQYRNAQFEIESGLAWQRTRESVLATMQLVKEGWCVLPNSPYMDLLGGFMMPCRHNVQQGVPDGHIGTVSYALRKLEDRKDLIPDGLTPVQYLDLITQSKIDLPNELSGIRKESENDGETK